MVEPIKLDNAMAEIAQLLEQRGLAVATDYLRELHPADGAEILTDLDRATRSMLTARLTPGELATLLERMDDDEMAEVVEPLTTNALADVLDEMEPDDAADLLGELADDEVSALLDEMANTQEVNALLVYDPETAGGIMTTAPPSLRRWMTAAEALHFIKEHYDTEEDLHYLYVLDRYGLLIGTVSFRAFILADADQSIEEIMRAGRHFGQRQHGSGRSCASLCSLRPGHLARHR